MRIGIIGGSALGRIDTLQSVHREMVNTPYGAPSCPLTFGNMAGNEVVFLPRHGSGHYIAPHEVNYRANLFALKQLGVTHVIGAAAVGGISDNMAPLKLVFPDQIIDYTWGRQNTFHDGQTQRVHHVDFTYPYDETMRQQMIAAASELGLAFESRGVYGATQGPRLETAAEIQRMKRDGCDIVGMTGMPEAVLARELQMKYACCALVVNWAAGVQQGQTVSIHDIEVNLKAGMDTTLKLLAQVLPVMTE